MPVASPIDRAVTDAHVVCTQVASPGVVVHFEQKGSELRAVEIGRRGRSPVIAALHHALFALGIVVSTYQVRTQNGGLVERLVLERRDGGSIDGQLSSATRAAILPIAMEESAG